MDRALISLGIEDAKRSIVRPKVIPSQQWSVWDFGDPGYLCIIGGFYWPG